MTQRRRWFQIHLSTAVVLTLFSGLIFYFNFDKAFHIDASNSYRRHAEIGWPFVMRRLEPDNMRNAMLSKRQMRVYFEREPDAHFIVDKSEQWDVVAIVLNALCGVALLSVVAISVEHVIRCRTRQ